MFIPLFLLLTFIVTPLLYAAEEIETLNNFPNNSALLVIEHDGRTIKKTFCYQCINDALTTAKGGAINLNPCKMSKGQLSAHTKKTKHSEKLNPATFYCFQQGNYCSYKGDRTGLLQHIKKKHSIQSSNDNFTHNTSVIATKLSKKCQKKSPSVKINSRQLAEEHVKKLQEYPVDNHQAHNQMVNLTELSESEEPYIAPEELDGLLDNDFTIPLPDENDDEFGFKDPFDSTIRYN